MEEEVKGIVKEPPPRGWKNHWITKYLGCLYAFLASVALVKTNWQTVFGGAKETLSVEAIQTLNPFVLAIASPNLESLLLSNKNDFSLKIVSIYVVHIKNGDRPGNEVWFLENFTGMELGPKIPYNLEFSLDLRKKLLDNKNDMYAMIRIEVIEPISRTSKPFVYEIRYSQQKQQWMTSSSKLVYWSLPDQLPKPGERVYIPALVMSETPIQERSALKHK